MNRIDKIEDRLRVVDIALEGRLAEQKVMEHTPGNHFGLLGRQTEQRAKRQRDLSAQHRMIAAAPLGDVVQQNGGVEGAAGLQVIDDAGCDRRRIGQLATLQRGNHA